MRHDKSPSSMGLLDKIFVGCLLVVFGGIVLHAPLTVALGTVWPQYDLLIKSWKEVALGLALILGVIILTRRHRWSLLNTPIVYAMTAFAALSLALIPLFYTGFEATVAGLFINIRFMLFFGLVYVAMLLYPSLSRLFIRVGVAGAALVVGFAVLQATVLPHDILKYVGYGPDTIMPYLTVDQNYDYVRINSTLRGPNPLGAYAAIVLAVSMAWWLRGPKTSNKRQLATVLLIALGSVVALWTSYSRSAALAALAAVGIVLFVSYGRRISRAVWASLAVLALLVGGSLVALRDTPFVSQVVLHEDPFEGNDVNSNDGHAESLADGVWRMANQPLGAGIGSTGSASLHTDKPVIIENHYLFVAHEAGWAGLALFLYIYYLVLSGLWKRRAEWLAIGVFASGVGLAIASLFLPVWVDDTVSLVWWGLAAVALTLAQHKRNRS